MGMQANGQARSAVEPPAPFAEDPGMLALLLIACPPPTLPSGAHDMAVTFDDLPYVLQYAGEDHIIIGSDYGHNDTSSEIMALQTLKAQGDVSPAVIDKILDANARALYAL